MPPKRKLEPTVLDPDEKKTAVRSKTPKLDETQHDPSLSGDEDQDEDSNSEEDTDNEELDESEDPNEDTCEYCGVEFVICARCSQLQCIDCDEDTTFCEHCDGTICGNCNKVDATLGECEQRLCGGRCASICYSCADVSVCEHEKCKNVVCKLNQCSSCEKRICALHSKLTDVDRIDCIECSNK